MSEKWLPVVGYEGYYEVSDLGHVRSTRAATNSKPGRLLKQRGGGWGGYYRVCLSRDGVPVTFRVHHLVLEAFTGARPEGMVACHANDIKHDNRAENLRWATPRENNLDAVVNGRNHHSSKDRCLRGHLFVQANLVSNAWTKHGHRNCLSCNRESALSKSQRREFDPIRADARAVELGAFA